MLLIRTISQGSSALGSRPAAVLSRLTLLLGLVASLAFVLPASARADACAPLVNPVACENTQAGTPPSEWEIYEAGDSTIQGFATAMSVNRGQSIGFKIKSSTSNYRVSILRLGYYDGDGARTLAANLTPTNTAVQPACVTDSSTGLVDCGNWNTSLTWTVPATAVSGVYIALLKRQDTGGMSHITFVVRDDSSHSAIALQTSDATWQAYNAYGGNSLYKCTVDCPPGDPTTYKAAYAVSYNRPLNTAVDDGRSYLFTGAEWPMIRFLEANGYDVSYISQVDTQSNPALLRNHRLFISSGHDEYWSAQQRTSMEQARDAGVNLAFFSGNTGFWKTRYAASQAGPATANRTLISYKDTHFPQQVDPVSWTGTWRDGRFATAADNIRPENALTGGSFLVNSGTSQVTVPQAFGKLRMWRNTDAATLGTNGRLTLAPSTLGYEWDVDADNGFRPAGNIRLSETTASDLEVFTDYGSSTELGQTATHNLTMYKAPSGARVFNSNTVQWAWGLDDNNPIGSPADRNMQQATVNLLADLDAQPGTRAANLSAASKTTDTTPPTATLNATPSSVADTAQITLSGTASDTGGIVAGIEVSTDGGVTWHPATIGTTSWTYSWLAHGNPSTTIRVRATDDSGNTGAATAARTINVDCPCSLWGGKVAPSVADGGDPSPVEVGMKFRTTTYGNVTGLRFYKASNNTGTHVGSLWSSAGVRLAQATFSGETASGWQTVNFSPAIEALPGETYTVSYFAPNGHYSATSDYFYRTPAPGPNGGAITESGPLSAVINTGTTRSTTSNGVYSYGATSAFPVNSFAATNYWIDPIFVPLPVPGAVSNVGAVAGGITSANVTWTAPTTGGTVKSYRITPYIGAVAQTPRTVTGSPPETTASISGLTQGTTYTFRVEAVNPNGSGPLSAASNAVTPSVPVAPSRPLAVAAKPAGTQAQVTWSPSASNGDSAITAYTVTPYIGASAQIPVQVGASTTSATVTGLTNGTAYTFRVTATNGVGTSPASDASNVTTPRSTIFDFTAPAVADAYDSSPVEVGVKFQADSPGTITGLRFYKAAANSGPHQGTLWSASGTPLRQVTFTNESASGWQTAEFSSPVAITAGTTYVASYYAPTGHYSATLGGLLAGADNGLLHALPNGTSANGVYAYSPTSTFPTNTYDGTNYWVDVLYSVPVPGQATGVTATAGGFTSANVTWAAPSSGGPVSGFRVTPYIGSTAQTPKTINSASATSTTITGLTTGTSYTFRVQAFNDSGLATASAASNAVTPLTAVAPSSPSNVLARPATNQARVAWTASASDGDSAITGYTVTPYIGAAAQTPVQVGPSTTSTTVTGLSNGVAYTFHVTATNSAGTSPASSASTPTTPQVTVFDFATPSISDSSDTGSVEVGVKFQTSFAGTVTGIRFYKSSANTGTHVGSLWTAGGTRLAQVTFTDESDTGWQAATFSTPIAITAGTTYVASYFAPKGHYSTTSGGLATGTTNSVLTALANSTSTNGVFAYSSSSTFPQSTFDAGNYWVDVLFAPAGAPGQVAGLTATAGQSAVTLNWNAPMTGGPATAYRITPYIGAAAQTPIDVTGSPLPTSRTLTGLTPGTAYTFRVQASNPGGDGPASAASAPVTPLGATAPGTPTAVSAQGDSTSANVSWSAPASDGGSAITGYSVTPYAGATAQTPVQVGGSTTRTRVTGLTNGTAYTFVIRATNAAGTSTASTATSAVTPRASLFELATPVTPDSGDGSSVVLGVKFTADTDGTITGLRFYKSPANSGSHVGTLHSTSGTVLAQGTFADETASGWQTLTFTTPATITAGTTYVASYLAPNGHYAVTGGGFAAGPVDNPPLHALADGMSPNGVYGYSSTPVQPVSSYNASNYWVDVLFAPAA
jgi:hypothetical protein